LLLVDTPNGISKRKPTSLKAKPEPFIPKRLKIIIKEKIISVIITKNKGNTNNKKEAVKLAIAAYC
jgi:hypothetical protein